MLKFAKKYKSDLCASGLEVARGNLTVRELLPGSGSFCSAPKNKHLLCICVYYCRWDFGLF
jgi:hypothetical protein